MNNAMFRIWAAEAVHMLRNAGVNETIIACVLQRVRAAAIHEERFRQECLQMKNAPQFPELSVFTEFVASVQEDPE